MMRRSYGKARQSTLITDSVKSEQRGGLHGEQGHKVSLSLKPAHSLSKLGIGSLLMFCFDSGEGERRSLSCFLSFLFFFFSFFPNKKKKKKPTWKWRRFGVFNASSNRPLTEPWIEKNWKLEDWIDKTES